MRNHYQMTRLLLTLGILLLFFAAQAGAKEISLSWIPNQETELAGYKIYYGYLPGSFSGTDADQGPSPIDVGNSVDSILSGLDANKPHYIVITAYNFAGQESGYSQEAFAAPTDQDNDGYDKASDCNDKDAAIYPGAREIPYNGIDENCNGLSDDDDLDQDGFAQAEDCDDTKAAISPAAEEITGNHIDENCNGMADDTFSISQPQIIAAETGYLTSPMKIIADASAGGGSYITTTKTNQGTATFKVSIPRGGIYKMVARVYASDSGSDSFYVKLDDRPEFIWDLNPAGAASQFKVWRDDEVTSRGNGSFSAPQFDPFTVQLQAGTYQLVLRGREPDTRIDQFSFVLVSASSAIDTNQADNSPAPLSTDWIEAETGVFVGAMRKVTDSAADGGAYIESTLNNSGTAGFQITVPATGSYKIEARVFSANNGSDSYFLSIDNGPEFVWDLNPSGDPSAFNLWRIDEVTNRGAGSFKAPQFDPYFVQLTKGTHTLRFRAREWKTRLDSFTLIGQ